MGNPTDKAINPIIPEQKCCSKCKQCLYAWNEITGQEACMNIICENYKYYDELIRKYSLKLKQDEVYCIPCRHILKKSSQDMHDNSIEHEKMVLASIGIKK